MVRKFAVIGITLVLALLITALVTDRPTGAQDAPASLRAALERLNMDGTTFVVRFASPVAGGLDVLLPDAAHRIEEIGGDYFCFSSPWNDTRRVYCTPYSNVSSVSYVR